MIWIDFIGGSDIPIDFSMDYKIFGPLTGPVAFISGPKRAENQYFRSKMAAQSRLFGFQMILIDFISDSNIPIDFSMDSNIFRPLTGPLGFHFGPKKGRKSVFLVKIGGSRSIIWIPNDFDRLYWWFKHPY